MLKLRAHGEASAPHSSMATYGEWAVDTRMRPSLNVRLLQEDPSRRLRPVYYRHSQGQLRTRRRLALCSNPTHMVFVNVGQQIIPTNSAKNCLPKGRKASY